MPEVLEESDELKVLLRYYYGDAPLSRQRVNIMSAGYVFKGVAITRALLHRIVADAKERGDVLTISAPECGVLGFASNLEVDGNDIWADVVLGPGAPAFERAAAVVCPTASGAMIVGLMLTNISREDILRLNNPAKL